MPPSIGSLSAALLLGAALVSLAPSGCEPPGTTLVLPGLLDEVRVVTDADGVRHIFARNDFDLFRAQGYVHARDRLFQMDQTRRQVSGDLSELLGIGSFGGDTQAQLFGLRRAAERSLTVLSQRERDLLQAYADGVNAFLAQGPLPPEYALLELTQVRPWTPVDTLAIGKAIAAQLSLSFSLTLNDDLAAYIAAGQAQGFDGEKLFFEDARRTAPMDPASSIPDATEQFPFLSKARVIDRVQVARAAALARRAREQLAQNPLLAEALDRRDTQIGSNEWGVAGQHTTSGRPIIANDPHLALQTPSIFYEVHLVVDGDPQAGDLNASGVGFPGAPGVILGQNEDISWGATTNPMDVTDLFTDTLVALDPACQALGSDLCILSEGQLHPVETRQVGLMINARGDGIPDNLFPAPLSITVRTVPFRSFGPILEIEDSSVVTNGGTTTALVAQYTGFHATRELETFVTWNRARNLDDFLDGLADFDFGSQNWIYADKEGRLAYFTSGELPLRRDLEQGFVHGLPPAFIRDGSGPANWVPDPAHSQGQSIPFAILPFEEMPHAIDPPRGWVVNANNDPAGTNLDNDPLNQFRPSKPSAIYYLNFGYNNGLRAGRITRLIREHLARGQKISVADMARFQGNTQQLDAELLVPFLEKAFERASKPGATPQLAAFAADPRIADAFERLRDWDFSTPTGLPEGWDASDEAGVRTAEVSEEEARASVAATIYNLWRGRLVRSVVDDRLTQLGVPGAGSSEALVALHHLLVQEPFTGVGASGVDFFPQPAGLSAKDRRDVTLLTALRDAIDLAASASFAAAFGQSSDPDDWRWGKLHRITFRHPFEASFSIPPQAGFQDVGPGLPGIARDGGFEVVNASSFSSRSTSVNGFTFSGGPVRKYVGQPRIGSGSGPRIEGINVIPGGPSGIPGDPLYAIQLPMWLTGERHEVDMRTQIPAGEALSVEALLPGP